MNRRGPKAGGGSELPPIRIPKDVEIDSSQNVRPAAPAPQTQVLDSQEFARQTGAQIGETALLPDRHAGLVSGLQKLSQILRLRFGAPETLVARIRPNHADRLLVPAVEVVLRNVQALRDLRPDVMRTINVEAMQQDLGRLREVREVMAVLSTLLNGLSAASTHLEVTLDEPVREIGREAKGIFERHQTLGPALEDLRRLMAEDVEKSSEVKAAFGKVRAETEEKTLDRVKEDLAQGSATQGGIPASPPRVEPPAPVPPVDLSPKHAPIGRKKGKR